MSHLIRIFDFSTFYSVILKVFRNFADVILLSDFLVLSGLKRFSEDDAQCPSKCSIK